ncbi:hypothetical protein [Sphingobacterium sp. UME9]|uniref:hypothetical protein n=1 Tax=Sphingobacterium TaxID=28453 RepID=UPI001601B007|nr:hypothetical protein [Sphingobacterium sp. UME9]MBB1642790.1 hypothetical protein [Sphingobacterium sp. UME9]
MSEYSALFFCLLSTIVYGGDKLDQQVSQYYHYKNQAEVHILDSSYKHALESYNVAFTYKYPNIRDLYNAFAVAYLVADSNAAKHFFDEMVLNGQTIEKFAKGRFVTTIHDESLYKWLTKNYDSLKSIADKSEKKLLAARYDSIYDEDQRIRKTEHKTQGEIKKLISEDSANIKNAIRLIKEYGFPSYERIGLFEKGAEGYAAADNCMWMLLWHARHSNHTLNGPVRKAVLAGDYPPDEFALIIDMQADTSLYFGVLPRKADKNGKVIFEEVPDMQAVNERRATLYLESLEEYKRKLNYQKYVDKRFYMSSVWGDILNYAPMDFRKWGAIE